MQALIDFDGWRKWKDFAAQSDSSKDKSGPAALKSAAAAGKKKKEAAVKDVTPKKKEVETNGIKEESKDSS